MRLPLLIILLVTCIGEVRGQGILDTSDWRPVTEQVCCPDGNCSQSNGEQLAFEQLLMYETGEPSGESETGWREARPIREVASRGMLGEIESRVSPSFGQQYRNKPLLWSHEALHRLNCDISNQVLGYSAFYVGNETCCVIRDLPSSIKLSHVTARVRSDPTITKGKLFQLYMINKVGQDNENFPLIILDELSAYMGDILVGIETRGDRETIVRDLAAAEKFYTYSMHLGRLVEASNYNREDLALMGEFLIWSRERLDVLQQQMKAR